MGYTYDNAGHPESVTGIASYVTSLSYTELGQPLQYQLDSSPNVYLTDTWDPQTGWLTQGHAGSEHSIKDARGDHRVVK